MCDALIRSLNAAGKGTELLRQADGSRVLVLPYGGRVLGLYAPKSDENFLWTNPNLETSEAANRFYAGSDWHNSGGDRTWLSPELDLFFPDYPRMERYFQPRELDPGEYQVTRTADGVRLTNRLTIKPARSKAVMDVEIQKSISSAPHPLRCEQQLSHLMQLEYAGYAQRTSLSVLGEATATAGAWNLLQLPHGGEMLIPTNARTAPKVYFGDIRDGDLVSGDHLVRYRMHTPDIHKIGIRALATTGRVGYLLEKSGHALLVIRNFFVNPSGEYIDVPWQEPDDLGYAVQACNVVHESLGSFSELEYHMPAIGKGTGRLRYDDESQVWAFRGPCDLIRAAAGVLLSAEVANPS